MSEIVAEAVHLLGMLPETEQNFACELIRRLVRAWDPDYTKLTPEEAKHLQKAENSGFVAENEIDWDNLSQYNN